MVAFHEELDLLPTIAGETSLGTKILKPWNATAFVTDEDLICDHDEELHLAALRNPACRRDFASRVSDRGRAWKKLAKRQSEPVAANARLLATVLCVSCFRALRQGNRLLFLRGPDCLAECFLNLSLVATMPR
jgi:hypothetical protein